MAYTHVSPFLLLNETRAKEAISVQSMTQAVLRSLKPSALWSLWRI